MRQGRAGRERHNQRHQRTNHMGEAGALWVVGRGGALVGPFPAVFGGTIRKLYSPRPFCGILGWAAS